MDCPACHRHLEEEGRFCPECGAPLTKKHSLNAFRSRPTGEAGAVLGGRYRIHGLIGRGATARVYLAEDLRGGDPVAVKILAPIAQISGNTTKRRFIREAKAAMSVSHPNVVRLFDVAERGDGTPYLVVELLEGETLGELLRREGEVAIDRALILMRQAATGLWAAHRAGVVHRDIKPDNLFLVGEIGDPFGVKVIDFGLAKVGQRGDQSTSGLVVGTIEYMAPEQVLGDPTDARTDVYGLGAVMFRVLTGQLPFDTDDGTQLLAHHLHTPTAPPSWLNDELDERIDRVIMTAMRKHPDNRYPSMATMLADLDRLVGFRGGSPAGAPMRVRPDVYEPQSELGKAAAEVFGEKLGARW